MQDPGSGHFSIEVLADEFIERHRNGERPALTEYTDRFPEHAAQINELFPEILKKENLDEVQNDTVFNPRPKMEPHFGRLGDFRIIGEIGRGGMGIVYEAEQVSLGRHVALKVLPRELLANPKQRSRFEREAKAAAKLHHTNIVPVFGVGEDDGMGYYVMQFIQGLALDKVLEELKRLNGGTDTPEAQTQTAGLNAGIGDSSAADLVQSLMTGTLQRIPGKVDELSEQEQLDATCIATGDSPDLGRIAPSLAHAPRKSDSTAMSNSSVTLPVGGGRQEKKSKKNTYWQSVAEIGVQVAEALDYAHNQGVLHRDIKPANLLLDMQGTVWVTDFGLAKLDDDRGLTQTGDILGTLRYMAPETFKGEADARSEVHGLGLTLYELLAFRPAFEQMNRNRLVDQVMTAEIEHLSKLNPEIPADLQTIVHKAIERNPAHRYQTAKELADDLQRYIDDEPIKARRISLVERLARWSRHNKSLAASLAGVSVLVTVIAVGSMIAAGYFRNLSTQLNKARNVALGQAEENLRLANDKEAARKAAVEATEREKELTQVAKEATQRVQDQRDINRRNLYYAQMQLSQQAWGLVKGVPRMLSILEQWRPKPGEDDLRGWEWYYLKSLEHTEETLITAHEGSVRCCAWSLDGRLLATGGDDATIVISSTDGQTVRTLKGHADRVTSLCWKPDGTRIASVGSDKALIVWDATTGESLIRIEHEGLVRGVAWSHNGKWVATGTADKISVWNAADGSEWKSLPATGDSIAFAPADDQIVFQGRHITNVWPLESSERRAIAVGKSIWYPTVALSPDGTWFAVPQQSDIYIRSVETGEIIKTLRGHKLPPVSLSISADGRRLASSGGENVVNIWDIESGELVNVLRGQLEDVSCVQWHPDGERLASCSNDVRIWNTSRSDGDLEVQTGNERSYTVCWSPDGRQIATAGHGGIIEVRNPETGALLVSFTGHNRWTQSLAWHPKKPVIASTGFDGAVRFWNADTGELLRDVPSVFIEGRTVAWNPAGTRLAAGGNSSSEEIVVLDSDRFDVIGRFSAAGMAVQSLSWKFDGTRLASAGFDGLVRVWDATTHERLQVINAHESKLWCLAWSSNGDRLAAGGDYSRIRVWETKNWQQVVTLVGHTSIVYGLAWNKDDSRLITASHDNTAIVWDTTSYAEIMNLRQGRDQLHGIAWDPDAIRLASVDSRGYLHVLDATNAFVREQSPNYLSNLNRRLEVNPDDADALHLRWRIHLRMGRAEQAAADRALLVTTLQRIVAKEPSERFVRLLTDFLTENVEPNWTVLQPTEMKSRVRAQLSRQSDGSIFAAGEPVANDSYTIDLSGKRVRVEVLRLEALTDTDLPSSGPGWGSGNFHLTEFRAFVKRPGQESAPIAFRSAHASYIRSLAEGAGPDDGPPAAIDGNQETVWDIWPQAGKRHWLMLRLAEPLELTENDHVIVELDFLDKRWPVARLGRFRFSVIDNTYSIARAKLRLAIAEKTLSGSAELAAVQIIGGEPTQAIETLDAALPNNEPVELGVRLLLLAIARQGLGDIQGARDACEQILDRLGTVTLPPEFQSLAADMVAIIGGLDPIKVAALMTQLNGAQELIQFLRMVQRDPSSPDPFLARGVYHARFGRWRESADDYLQAIKLRPDERIIWSIAASSLVFAGDEPRYRQLCVDMRNQFRGSDKPEVADSICKSCLLLPGTKVSELPVANLRERALQKEGHPYQEWFTACCALISYREGEPQKAIEWAAKAGPLTAQPGTLAAVVRAMAEHQLGQTDKAHETLSQVAVVIPVELRTLGTQAYTGTIPVQSSTVDSNWMFPEILRREAAALINGDSKVHD